ncbi:ABC transporter permease [Roseateles sp.]|uniref:ABC transporter permease n=1 Tax=Roseateles sp. TaxID=1971397 RepID=UPI003BA832CA
MSYTLIKLALASAWNRRFTLGLTLLALTLSVAMLLGVERARTAARESFEQSISGTDLLVGARGSPLQLTLYAVFRIGESSQNMQWQSFQAVAAHPSVAWAIPLSLGDSHRGFPVIGTTSAYFEHFRYGQQRPLSFSQGQRFERLFDVVLGAEVAEKLGYSLGDRLVLSHGSGPAAIGAQAEHADKPFTVVGILARTGTPVDRSLHIDLPAMEAIHLGWQAGAPIPGFTVPAEFVGKFDLQPKSITAGLFGLKSRAAVFRTQRWVQQYTPEALQAVLPGVALDQLWQMVDVLEKFLKALSALVVAMGLSSMVAIVWASLSERRRELAILRSVGAGPWTLAALLTLEGVLLAGLGALFGYLLLTGMSLAAAPWVQAQFGLALPLWSAWQAEMRLLGYVLLAGLLAALLPAWSAARMALADGLNPRL